MLEELIKTKAFEWLHSECGQSNIPQYWSSAFYYLAVPEGNSTHIYRQSWDHILCVSHPAPLVDVPIMFSVSIDGNLLWARMEYLDTKRFVESGIIHPSLDITDDKTYTNVFTPEAICSMKRKLLTRKFKEAKAFFWGQKGKGAQFLTTACRRASFPQPNIRQYEDILAVVRLETFRTLPDDKLIFMTLVPYKTRFVWWSWKEKDFDVCTIWQQVKGYNYSDLLKNVKDVGQRFRVEKEMVV